MWLTDVINYPIKYLDEVMGSLELILSVTISWLDHVIICVSVYDK